MKSFAVVLLIVLSFILMGSYNSKNINFTTNTSGKIMAFRPLTLLEDVHPSELERFGREQLTPTFKNENLIRNDRVFLFCEVWICQP